MSAIRPTGSWLVVGGARSGKSRYAQDLAADCAAPCYVATGWAGDAEMAERIRKHQAERGAKWRSIETRVDLAGAIAAARDGGADFVLVDCLTLWVSNLMMAAMDVEAAAAALAAELPRLAADSAAALVMVSNEVGCGIVPDNPAARGFRDAAGRVNQLVAAAADNVVLVSCGLPLVLKGAKCS